MDLALAHKNLCLLLNFVLITTQRIRGLTEEVEIDPLDWSRNFLIQDIIFWFNQLHWCVSNSSEIYLIQLWISIDYKIRLNAIFNRYKSNNADFKWIDEKV